MSTVTTVTHDGADAAKAIGNAARPGRSWLDSVQDEAVSFFKGENSAPWAILADVVLGCVPIAGQLIDARDVIKGLAAVAAAPQSPSAWFDLMTAVVGIVPGGGDIAKGTLRGIKRGTLQIDDLLAVVRRFYKGDPEALVRSVVDPGKIVAKLEEVLSNPTLLKQVGPETRRTIDVIRKEANAQAVALRKQVDEWLSKGRKTSAHSGPAAKATPGAPGQKPATRVNEGQRTKGEHRGDATHSTPNASTSRTERFKRLGSKAMGVFGEHMADYHGQDVRGWYATSKVTHDKGRINIAKMNDNGHLVQLWPLQVRGRGIDAVWRTEKGTRPFAVVEAKASVDPTRNLGSLLGDAGDKTESDRGSPSPGESRGGGAGGRGRGRSRDVVRQRNGKVTQMSHAWIKSRLESAVNGEESLVKTFRSLKERAYSRHVLFFSVPQAAAHVEALITLMAGRPLDEDFHAGHQVTREWGDNEIEKVVNDRAGIAPADRGKRR